jgi:hypothetical protein
MSYGVSFYRGTEWIGVQLYIETESEAREIAESWIAESPTNHGYELSEGGYIYERSIKR